MPVAERLDAITTLRFFAAAAIVVWHLSPAFCTGWCVRDFLQLPQGVSFFFVLSGFVLAHTYGRLDATGAVRGFWAARIARIWPVHLLAFGLAAWLVPPLRPAEDVVAVTAANLTLTQAWIPLPQYFLSYNDLSWTISVEASFYLTFPLWIAAIGRTWHWKLGIALALAIATLLVARALGIGVGTTDTLEARGWGYSLPTVRVFEFVLGIAAYRCFGWVRRHWALQRGQSTAVELGLVILCFFSLWQARFVFYSPAVVLWITEPTAHWLAGSGSAVVFAALIVVFALQRGALSAALRRPVLVLLGEISFAVYMLHGILWQLLGPRWFRPHALNGALAWLQFWAALLLLSYLVWRFYEMPMRRLLRRWLSPPAQSSRPPAISHI